jgi:lysophospholipase L1-like esterase
MGEDYKYLEDWGQIANLSGKLGKLNEDELQVEYQYATQRIDLIQVDAAGRFSVKKGLARMVCPMIPQPDVGASPLAGVYVAPWRREGKFVVAKDDIFPIAPAPPVAPINKDAVAKTLQKLKDSKEVKIAIMGASIELGAEACAWWDDKIKFTDKDLAYRGRVVVGLRKRFPKATVTPVEAYQGGTQTKFGLEVLDKTVIPAKADLVLIGFGGNDVSGPIGKGPNNPPEEFKKDMKAMVAKAKAAGMEVMLVVTMQQNPWARNQVAQRWPDYRKALLELGQEEKVGVADVYTEWMNLATRGIPPFSQLHNWINHPGPFGHGVYADVILRFFE